MTAPFAFTPALLSSSSCLFPSANPLLLWCGVETSAAAHHDHHHNNYHHNNTSWSQRRRQQRQRQTGLREGGEQDTEWHERLAVERTRDVGGGGGGGSTLGQGLTDSLGIGNGQAS